MGSSVRAVLRRLVEARQLSVKCRLDALMRLRGLKCPTALLERLLHDPETHPKLLNLALEMWEARKVVRDWKRRGSLLSPCMEPARPDNGQP